jgi:hypothetical protein
MIRSLFKEYLALFCVLCFGPLVAKPRMRSDRNLLCEVSGPSGTYTQVKVVYHKHICYFTLRCLRTMFCDKRAVNRECVASPLPATMADNA